MTPEDIAALAQMIHARSGVIVDPDKLYVIETRLAPIARREGFITIGELVTELRARQDQTLMWAVVEAMSSTETQFFRDKVPFDQLREDILPALAKARSGPVRMWSLGCSTGQEAYSMAMAAHEEGGRYPALKIEIQGGDLSERCLEKANAGLYTQFEVQRGLPARLLVKYFEKVDDAWAVSPRIRQMVRMERVNLLTDLIGAGPFDVIFCRHVLSAFDDAARAAVLGRLAGALARDGYLVLGLEETIGTCPAFHPVADRPGLYTRSAEREIAAAV